MIANVAHICLAKVGERVSGDAVLVRGDPEGRLLLAVVDGLGHGPDAAAASMAALSVLQASDLGAPLLSLMQSVHARLRGTRGAAATVCLVRGRKLEVCAVGNVQLTSTNATVPLVLSSGVLGHRVSRFRVCEGELRPGARVALYSDGISPKFRLEEGLKLKPKEACKLAIERHRNNDDDSTILIADMDG